MKKIAAPLAATALLAGAFAATPVTHASAATVPHYKNCAALVKQYPHGVRVSNKKLNRYYSNGSYHFKATAATVNTKVYNANTHLDADKDGIACER